MRRYFKEYGVSAVAKEREIEFRSEGVSVLSLPLRNEVEQEKS